MAAYEAQTETIWGFLNRTEPGTLILSQDPVQLCMDAEPIVSAYAEVRGIIPIPTSAPTEFQAEGLHTVYAFPTWILSDIFPINP